MLKVRANATNAETFSEHFIILEKTLRNNGLTNKPASIFNINKTGMPLNHKPLRSLLTENKEGALTDYRKQISDHCHRLWQCYWEYDRSNDYLWRPAIQYWLDWEWGARYTICYVRQRMDWSGAVWSRSCLFHATWWSLVTLWAGYNQNSSRKGHHCVGWTTSSGSYLQSLDPSLFGTLKMYWSQVCYKYIPKKSW